MRSFIFLAVLGVLLLQQAEIGSFQPTDDDKDECQDAINYEKGTIVNPRYPYHYKPEEDCIWKIKAPPGLTLSLRFKTFELEGSDDYAYDYVTVYDGPTVSSPSFGKFTGDRVPDLITSSQNQMTVHFHTNYYFQLRGFSATFSTNPLPVVSTAIPSQELSPCGGYIQDANGTIKSPNYPRQYEPLRNCTWTIMVPDDSQIYLILDYIAMEFSPDCKFDQVTVLDGDDAESPVIAVFCGDEIGRRILSSKNKITVKFTSDDTFERMGFRGTFRKVLSCGGNITAENGVIQSPNGTTGYSCTWIITVPEDYRVLLKVRENRKSYDPKRYFEMIIRDGPHADGDLLGRDLYWNDNLTVLSFSNQLRIVVTSYGSEDLSHLYAEFEQYSCGGDISADAGAFMSPNFPNNYYPKEICTWKITVPENYQVHLTFQTFRLESSEPCGYDYVKVFDGHDNLNSRLLGTYCGTRIPKAIYSTTDKITVVFVSDSSVTATGFSAEFSGVAGTVPAENEH